MFQQVFERVQVATVDRLLHVLTAAEAETRCGNDESHKWHGTKSNDAHINAGCVRSRDDTCR